MLGVAFLAWWSARLRSSEGFVSEYFLGGRSLGAWALALTFAATAASGGTFVGFPARIYSHGWVLALWIAGYMVVPIVGMGLLGKRLNRVSQIAKAVTLPEVLSKRFDSAACGGVATLLIVFFMFCYLIAQFKAGSKILATLLQDVPLFQQATQWVQAAKAPIPILGGAEPAYLICLTLFAVVVVAYVVYGGFRAVVWTDVMQGVIMFFGVILMLVLVLQQTGGLKAANERLATMTPPNHGVATVTRTGASEGETTLPLGEWLRGSENEVLRVAEAAVFATGASSVSGVKVIEITTPWEAEGLRNQVLEGHTATLTERIPYASGAGQPGVYLSAPGPHAEVDLGYLSLTLAFSFFIFWCFWNGRTAGKHGSADGISRDEDVAGGDDDRGDLFLDHLFHFGGDLLLWSHADAGDGSGSGSDYA